MWAELCPWLADLEGTLGRPLSLSRLPIAAVGLLAVIAATLIGGNTRQPGARSAVGLAAAIAITTSLVSAIGSVTLLRTLGSARAIALGLTGVGAGVLVSTIAALVAARLDVPRSASESGTVSVRGLTAGACGTLVIAAWALASGHLLGHFAADAARSAVNEARDLVALVAERLIVSGEINAMAAQIAPPGGYLVTIDDQAKVLAGAGASVLQGTTIEIAASDPTKCRTAPSPRVRGRTLPCAVRVLTDGSRVVATVPDIPIAGGVVAAFGLAGLGMAFIALGIGGVIGGGTADDFERVTTTLDELGRGPRGLDRPIVALSLDEVGDLAVALAQLRRRLRPGLAEHQEALDRAEAANHARTEFLTLVSAELREPLDRILAGARALLDPEGEPMSEEQREDVRIVLSSATHLIDLIDEVLDLSAIATGQIPLKLGEIDIAQLVGDVAKAQRPLIQAKNVELKLRLSLEQPVIRGDERRLRQVITNIVSNAVKFTETGSITVSLERHGAEVEIAVRDTGPGMPDDQLPRLFTEFVQLGALKQRARGTGLGLAICKRLVEAHDGKVTAETKLGEGSTFRVTVPAAGPRLPANLAEAR